MSSNHKTNRLPAVAGTLAERTPSSAPRFVCGVKIHQPVVASNGAFIRAWAARRAKLAMAAKVRTTKS
jgi:hypothetical protein